MSGNLELVIVSPERMMFHENVSGVVLPAYDGEVGILPGHSDFVGLLGTGLLKIAREGSDDYWFIISSGVYQVDSGILIVCAELAESEDDIDLPSAIAAVEELETIFKDHERFSPEEYPAQKFRYDLNRARIEVCQRSQSVH